MKVWIVRKGVLRAYERTGECSGCGVCCLKFNYRYETATGQAKVALEATGEALRDYEGWAAQEWSEDGLTWRWWSPLKRFRRKKPCGRYEDGKCTFYGMPQRPAICTAFPLRPQDLKGLDCPYEWEERNGDH